MQLEYFEKIQVHIACRVIVHEKAIQRGGIHTSCTTVSGWYDSLLNGTVHCWVYRASGGGNRGDKLIRSSDGRYKPKNTDGEWVQR